MAEYVGPSGSSFAATIILAGICPDYARHSMTPFPPCSRRITIRKIGSYRNERRDLVASGIRDSLRDGNILDLPPSSPPLRACAG